jgi:hypothetical protein
MNDPQTIADLFYSAFAKGDFRGMGTLYHPEATFSDPAFPGLHGAEVPSMWEMLLNRAKGDISIEFELLSADEQRARVRWTANYLFSATGRKVTNVVTTEMEIENGLIIRQRDSFSFWKWSRQALGLPGWLLGWTGFLRRKVQENAREGLRRFMGR